MMDLKIMKPTEAYTMLMENVASVLDCREQGIQSGVLLEDMEDLEAINWLNSLTLWHGGYDRVYSPGIFNGFLVEYCKPEYAIGLQHFYPQLAAREGIELTNEIWDSSIDILIDIYDYALRTRELDGKQHWGVVFRDDYFQQWDNAFLNKRRPGLIIPNFLKKWLRLS
ncbi:hypothetical protein ABC233_004834 [Klebsiella pneumoniae]|nr:hypothetical protein [Escherichia coli]EKU2163622.1 hypothetical protein [Klebsiella pneumoniae]TXU71828.1 hypothetical protein D4N05_20635 [Klebsiella oxytoca]EKW8636058.1 hypothetical protein [Klebsiella pneumoniae]EKW8641785.1 hypothetical protein [Klebsiella pneumoniae]